MYHSLASASEIKPLSGMKVYSPCVSMSVLAFEKKLAVLGCDVVDHVGDGGFEGVVLEVTEVWLARFNAAVSECRIEIKRMGDRCNSGTDEGEDDEVDEVDEVDVGCGGTGMWRSPRTRKESVGSGGGSEDNDDDDSGGTAAAVVFGNGGMKR